MEIHLKCNCNKCNFCKLEGKAFRTSCGHLYCYNCAVSTFSEGNICLVCSSTLKESDLNEMLIGISAGPIKNIKKILESTYELVNWTNNQLLYENNRGNEKLKLIEKESEYSKSQAVKIALQLKSQTLNAENRIKELERQIFILERDNEELKSVFSEKSKKCDAWEKAYTNTRNASIFNGDEENLNFAEKNNMISSNSAFDDNLFSTKRNLTTHNYKILQENDRNNILPMRPLLNTPIPSPQYVKRTETTTFKHSTGFLGNFNQNLSNYQNECEKNDNKFNPKVLNNNNNNNNNNFQSDPTAIKKSPFFTSRKYQN